MKEKKPRIDTSPERRGLTDNPFGALAGEKKDLPAGKAPEAPPKSGAPKAKYAVEKSRKGGYKIRMEKRASDRVVTVLEGITGDVGALARDLQKAVGAGGKASGGAVEIQGDHRTRVEAYLRDRGL